MARTLHQADLVQTSDLEVLEGQVNTDQIYGRSHKPTDPTYLTSAQNPLKTPVQGRVQIFA